MLEDFCHCLWDTRINSDVVSSDGYEISNLISRDKSQKRKGFLAAGFVKPVVTILLSFPFPVDLYVVNMNLQVGAQRTCGLEIFAASVKSRSQQDIDSTMIISKDNDTRILSRQDSQGLHCYQYDLNINNIKQEFKNLFVQILRVRLPEGKIGHFLNPCFKSTPQVHCNSKIVGNASTNVHKCVLQHGHLLRRTSHLIIRITQVHKGSVPCLGGIEVFGQPAQNSGTFVMNYARLISSRLKEEKKETPNGLCTRLVETNKQSCVGSTEGSPLATLGSSGLSNGTSSLGDHVPEDFIDPITLSIMTLPVLLPSGTTIDQTTLERHIHSEKSWGRPPSDPFTGLALGSKVIPNAALKCRIDNFLLSSDINVSNLGRTVGSLSDRGSTTTVNLNAMKEGRKWQKSDQLLQKLSRKNKCTVDEPDDGQAPSKRHKSEIKEHNSPIVGDLDQALEEALSSRRKPAIFKQNVSVSSLVKACGSKSNGKKLDTEPKSATDPTSHGCPHQGQAAALFQLPCQHIICRSCLRGAIENNNQCPNCQRNFNKKNVARVHSIHT